MEGAGDGAADPLLLLPLLLPLLPYVVVVPLLVMLLVLQLRAAGCDTGPTPRPPAGSHPGHTAASRAPGTMFVLLLLLLLLPASEATSGPPLVHILWLRSPDPLPAAPTTACGTSRQAWAAALMLPMQGGVPRSCGSSGSSWCTSPSSQQPTAPHPSGPGPTPMRPSSSRCASVHTRTPSTLLPICRRLLSALAMSSRSCGDGQPPRVMKP